MKLINKEFYDTSMYILMPVSKKLSCYMNKYAETKLFYSRHSIHNDDRRKSIHQFWRVMILCRLSTYNKYLYKVWKLHHIFCPSKLKSSDMLERTECFLFTQFEPICNIQFWDNQSQIMANIIYIQYWVPTFRYLFRYLPHTSYMRKYDWS